MKIKRLLITICAVIVSLCFVGCGNNQSNSINMSRYFNSKVTSSATNYSLSSFTGSSLDNNTVASHTYLKFQGNLSWIYGMTIESAYFYFYSTRTTNSQFIKITISNLEEEYNQTIEIETTKNTGKLVKIDIDSTVKSLSEELYITFTIDDPLVATGTYEWTIYNFGICGEHK